MKRLMLITTIGLMFLSCRKNVDTQTSLAEVDQKFAELLQESIDGTFGSIAGVSMSVVASELDITWVGAKGYDSLDKDEELSSDQPFRIASVTKTFVAAAILRLHEMDSISIEDPISKYISTAHQEILVNGGYQPNQILIKHCLNHTSGLFDYAMGNSTFEDLARENPLKRWTRTDQLEGAMKWGEKIGEPGKKYYYSDTGYILLGEIIENYFAGDLAKGLRILLRFDALGMENTWLESLEEAPDNSPNPVHRYFRQMDVSKWNPSVDLYGGGGLMSTSSDLSTFIHALFNHQVFLQANTLDLMLTKDEYVSGYQPNTNRRLKDYRYGLWGFTIYGEQAYMHGGLWGTSLIHIPAYNCSLAANFTKGGNDRLLKKAILTIKQLHDKK